MLTTVLCGSRSPPRLTPRSPPRWALALLRSLLALASQLSSKQIDLPMAIVGNRITVPKEPRLRHHETRSCRVDERHTPVEVDAVGESRADAGLLKSRDDPRGCSGLAACWMRMMKSASFLPGSVDSRRFSFRSAFSSATARSTLRRFVT